MHDKELGTGGVGAHGAGHGQNALCMRQRIGEAVVGKLSLDAVARAAHAVPVGASSLDHKSADHPMEDQAVIKSLLYQA